MSAPRLGPGDYKLTDEDGTPVPLLSPDRLPPDVLAQLEAMDATDPEAPTG